MDVINGKILLAQGDGELADPVPNRCVMGSGFRMLEKAGAFGGIMAKLITEDAKGAGGVAEATGYLRTRQLVDKIGAERLILALEG